MLFFLPLLITFMFLIESGVGIRQEVWVEFGGQNHAYDVTLEPLCDETGAIAGLTEVALLY